MHTVLILFLFGADYVLPISFEFTSMVQRQPKILSASEAALKNMGDKPPKPLSLKLVTLPNQSQLQRNPVYISWDILHIVTGLQYPEERTYNFTWQEFAVNRYMPPGCLFTSFARVYFCRNIYNIVLSDLHSIVPGFSPWCKFEHANSTTKGCLKC